MPAAFALARDKVPFAAATLKALFLAPLLLPTLVIGLALLMSSAAAADRDAAGPRAAATSIVTVPFVVRMMVTTLSTLPDEVEAAASTSRRQALAGVPPRDVAAGAPGIVAGSGFLAFLLSFDETVISLFFSGPRASTLPVEMVRYVEGRTDPMIAALSVLLIAGTLAVIVVVERLVGVTRAVGR